MEEQGIATFPRPVYQRIPNFLGAEIAAQRLTRLPEFQSANLIKVNPDSPQRDVRLRALLQGKRVLMPTPRLAKGFLLIDPLEKPIRDARFASTIRGAFLVGKKIPPDQIPRVDFIVVGSVAVSRNGSRIGKGGGYSELEYAILKELGVIEDSTKIATTIHDVQLIDEVPMEEHDLCLDYIVTPTTIHTAKRCFSRPSGIIWSKITEEMQVKIPLLKQLRMR
jgi:5-formyltetrahydrofolate cyclo-ligase